MGPGDFLKVTYKGRFVKQKDGSVQFNDEDPFTFQWDSRAYPAAVGKETFVPFEAVAVAMGDPRSAETVASVRDEGGNVSFVVDRATELRRLIVLYDNEMDDNNEGPMYAPDASVTDLEGEPIKTVLDDPAGESVTPVQTTILDRDQLMQQIQRQQRLIEQLADEQDIELPEVDDEPEAKPTTRAKKSAAKSNPFDEVPEG